MSPSLAVDDAVVPVTATTSAPAAAAVTVAPTPSTSQRQWASRSRRTAAAGRRRSPSDTSSDIAALAVAQATYYKRQLEIAELQHEMFAAQHSQTMATLAVQQQYYAAKLRKIAEDWL